jgi:fumarylacetoacetate (FAA) hydrolase
MKLASLNTGGRDGSLVVVSKDLTKAVPAGDIAPTLQAALDDWNSIEPKLRELAGRLESGEANGIIEFDEAKAHSPLPRAYQWADGSAYVNHVELVRKARGAEMPETFWTDPLMYQGGSDAFLAPREAIEAGDEAWGIDFEAEIAVITDDVPMGVSENDAGSHIKLFMLVNDVSLRNLIPGELGKGFGFFQAKPSSAFSPVAITPDELGDVWDGTKVNLRLRSELNGDLFGEPDAGTDMTFGFPKLVAHAAKTRPLRAGAIVGSGTVSNYDRSSGSSCLAEKRMLETIEHGEAKTPFMRFGDRIRIEMRDAEGRSIFGAIDQIVVKYEGP